LGGTWSISRLARAAGITPEHFSRRFARYAGCSPSAYLRSCRLQAAMARLRSSDEAIISVAGACGFTDLANFNRTFRRALGIAPGVYRKRFRSLQ
jgi:AraC family transcriptional regulator